MRLVASLGVGQAVLPPQPRPSLPFLRGLGYRGSDAEVIAAAAHEDDQLLRIASSAAAMWTANAATVGPSVDSEDGRLHFMPANLHAMLHRSIEADSTFVVLKAIFADPDRFAVHPPLPGGGQLSDEGAANHTRLSVDGRPAVHVFGWGRTLATAVEGPQRFPARQTLEASRAVARALALDPAHVVFAQQDPAGIDAGAFHTDVWPSVRAAAAFA
jgi:succinylarginine dihydrolase